MNIKKIAAVVLAPTAVTGTVLLGWATVHASTDHRTTQPVSHVTRHVTKPVTHRVSRRMKHAAALQRKPRPVRPARPERPAVHRVTRPAPPPPPPAPRPAASPASMTTGMSSFERCVAWRESGDNPTASSSGLFGILPTTWASLGYAGTAGQAPVALQKAAFDRLYAQYGTQPWAAYDGC